MRRRDGNKKRRVERQEQATERQATYAAMTTVEKFNRADVGTREFGRLLTILNADTDAALAIGAVRLG